MCVCGVHLQYSKRYYTRERWKRKSRVRYIKVTVGYKAQMDVQQSILECSSRFLGAGAVPLEC